MMKDKTTSTVISHVKSVFSRLGIPDEIMFDSMPFASLEF